MFYIPSNVVTLSSISRILPAWSCITDVTYTKSESTFAIASLLLRNREFCDSTLVILSSRAIREILFVWKICVAELMFESISLITLLLIDAFVSSSMIRLLRLIKVKLKS